MPSLAIDGVSYRPALDFVAETWRGGEFVGLIGPNGAGKSTLLRLIAGIWRPDAGVVRLDGADVHQLSHRARARRIAYLPQAMPEDVPFTVQQFVEMGRFAHHGPLGGLTPACRAAVDGALRMLDLVDLAQTPLAQLSGGERQRAALARCIAQDTSTLLLDEPISSLDLHYQMDILRTLQSVAAQGWLVVAAIHHLEFSAQFCSRLVLLDEGRVIASGPPEAVLTERTIQQVFRTRVIAYRDPVGRSLRFSYDAPIDSD